LQIGGSANTIYLKGQSSLSPAANITITSGNVPALYAYNNTTTLSVPGISNLACGILGEGTTVADGVQGRSYSSGIGVFGQASVKGMTNHGVRGRNLATSGVNNTVTSGLVGVSLDYDFYAEATGKYGPFTGAHDVLVKKGSIFTPGQIMVDVKLLVAKNLSATAFSVNWSSGPNQVAVGIYSGTSGPLDGQRLLSFFAPFVASQMDGVWNASSQPYPEYDLYKDQYDCATVNALGEGQLLVCNENGDLQNGDLICTSSTPGVGMKQLDDIIRASTVAKVRGDFTFENADAVLVPCKYLCG
jgi:hypothetical protein